MVPPSNNTCYETKRDLLLGFSFKICVEVRMHLKKLDSIRYSLQKVGLKACRTVIKEVRELLDEVNNIV